HRRRYRPFARHTAQLPARQRVRDGAPRVAVRRPGAGGARGADVHQPLALERRPRPRAAALRGRPQGADAPPAQARAGPPGRRRLRAEELLAAVFPEQLGCAENMAAGPIPIPDHPLVTETIDNCLREAMDVDGLDTVLAGVADGSIRTVAIDTVAPSPLSHEILHSNPYTYLDDAPLEERRARAVTLRQAVPHLAGGLGALDEAAIAEVARQAWPLVRDADELHDVLLSLGVVPLATVETSGWTAWAA